jgi:hypothetical protein
MIKKTTIGLSMLLLLTGMAYGQNKNKKDGKEIRVPMDERHWAAMTDNVEFITHRSVSAVQSDNEEGFGILLKDQVFTDGTIEFDVELKGSGFPGIDFRIGKDTLNSEKFYIRYFGTPDSLKRTTLQYAAVLDGVNMWDVTDDYQAAAKIHEGRWNHVKLVVSGKQMKVYVNDMQRAALHVPALEGITESGAISLTGNVIYANMAIKPNVTENLASGEGYDPTYNDSRYLRSWSVTGPIDFPFGRDVIVPSPDSAIDTVLFDSTAVWKPVRAERRALVNLTRQFGATERGQRRLAWVKTTISSETDQEKRIDMGFSDEVWVFINGQPLHIDKNYYGSPSMKEPRGRCTIENTSFMLPLKKGENEVLIGISNYFFGWGMIARLADTDGLQFD